LQLQEALAVTRERAGVGSITDVAFKGVNDPAHGPDVRLVAGS
jgi:hypothetical protein